MWLGAGGQLHKKVVVTDCLESSAANSVQILPQPFSTTITSPFHPKTLPPLCQFYYLIDKRMTCTPPHVAPFDPYLISATSARHKAILDYLHNAGFTKSFEQLKKDTKLVRSIWFLTGGEMPMHSAVDGLPARSRAEEQWPPRKEVDERDPDAKEGASLSSDGPSTHSDRRRRRYWTWKLGCRKRCTTTRTWPLSHPASAEETTRIGFRRRVPRNTPLLGTETPSTRLPSIPYTPFWCRRATTAR